MVNKFYKLYFPARDLDGSGFSFNGDITYDEIRKMEERKFKDTNSDINALMNGGVVSGVKHETYEGLSDCSLIDKINFLPFDALVEGPNNSVINRTYMDGFVRNGKMCVLFVNAKGEGMGDDLESELRFWIMDSDKVIGNRNITNKEKLMMLPVVDMKIDVEGVRYVLKNCKAIERRNVDVTPFNFAMLAEKVENNI